MLTPDYLDTLPDALVGLWQQVEDDILRDVARRIGKLADGSVATYQTLPWTMRGWHCGKGSKGAEYNIHPAQDICAGEYPNNICYQTTYRNTDNICSAEYRQHCKCLADSGLNRAKADRGKGKADHGVNSGNHCLFCDKVCFFHFNYLSKIY